MVFYIEEVPYDRTVYTYKSGCIFDELLEFYAFLNVWAVIKVTEVDAKNAEKAAKDLGILTILFLLVHQSLR